MTKLMTSLRGWIDPESVAHGRVDGLLDAPRLPCACGHTSARNFNGRDCNNGSVEIEAVPNRGEIVCCFIIVFIFLIFLFLFFSAQLYDQQNLRNLIYLL